MSCKYNSFGVVQSKGMERWVSMELARLNGICTNCWFPFPNHFVYALFREVNPGLEETSPFAPEIMTWKVMKVLPINLKRKGFESLRNSPSSPSELPTFLTSICFFGRK